MLLSKVPVPTTLDRLLCFKSATFEKFSVYIVRSSTTFKLTYLINFESIIKTFQCLLQLKILILN